MNPGSARVLVAFDDEPLFALVEYKLNKQGYLVSKAQDGLHAIEMLAEENFDVLLLDIMIQKADGFQVLAEAFRDPEHAPRVAVVVSSRGDEQDILRAFQLGAVDYVTKPFSLNVLVERIGIALRHKVRAGALA